MAKAPKAEPTLEELAHAQALRDVAIEHLAPDAHGVTVAAVV